MEIICADCGCLVDRGIRVDICGKPDCCCQALPIRRDSNASAPSA